jgi:hypothetical protein
MRMRCGPFTALALTSEVLMSASSVRALIQRVAVTVMPLRDTRSGASAPARGATTNCIVPTSSTTSRTATRRRLDPDLADGAACICCLLGAS